MFFDLPPMPENWEWLAFFLMFVNSIVLAILNEKAKIPWCLKIAFGIMTFGGFWAMFLGLSLGKKQSPY